MDYEQYLRDNPMPTKRVDNMTVFQIEDYEGNTIGAILTDKDVEIINIIGFDIADKEDFDENFGTTDIVIRIQANNKAMHLDDEVYWEEEKLDNMVRDTLPDDDYFEMNHYFD